MDQNNNGHFYDLVTVNIKKAIHFNFLLNVDIFSYKNRFNLTLKLLWIKYYKQNSGTTILTKSNRPFYLLT